MQIARAVRLCVWLSGTTRVGWCAPSWGSRTTWTDGCCCHHHPVLLTPRPRICGGSSDASRSAAASRPSVASWSTSSSTTPRRGSSTRVGDRDAHADVSERDPDGGTRRRVEREQHRRPSALGAVEGPARRARSRACRPAGRPRGSKPSSATGPSARFPGSVGPGGRGTSPAHACVIGPARAGVDRVAPPTRCSHLAGVGARPTRSCGGVIISP